VLPRVHAVCVGLWVKRGDRLAQGDGGTHASTLTPTPHSTPRTHTPTHKHVPFQGIAPQAVHEQGGMALGDVRAKTDKHLPEQVNVGLEDLLLGGRHGRRSRASESGLRTWATTAFSMVCGGRVSVVRESWWVLWSKGGHPQASSFVEQGGCAFGFLASHNLLSLLFFSFLPPVVGPPVFSHPPSCPIHSDSTHNPAAPSINTAFQAARFTPPLTAPPHR
jgi:hypothetical protein